MILWFVLHLRQSLRYKELIRMFKTLILSIFTASIMLMANASASEHLQLDQSMVKIDSRTTQAQNAALQQALSNVILKNSGSESALSAASVHAAIKNPASYIRQFGYQDIDGQEYLQASFDLDKVINLLREAHLPVWGKQRPLTLVWLTEPKQGEFTILNDASSEPTRSYIRSYSQSRGMPLLLPVMDLDDSMVVSVNDVRGMFAEHVAQASQRYSTDYFLMVVMEPNDNKVGFNMSFYPASSEGVHQPLIQHSGIADNQASAVNQILSKVTEFYAKRYAVADTGESLNKRLTFIDLNNRKELVDIEKFLEQLSAVKSVSLVQLKGSTVTFSLELFGSEDDLLRLLNLESKIRQQIDNVSSNSLSASQTEIVHYIWLGQ